MDQAAWNRFKEAMKERARLATFEGRIEQLEVICQRMPGTRPNRPLDVHLEEHSQAWYAEEILRAIRFVRHHLERGQASHAAAEALTVGALAAEAEARLNWPEMRLWLQLADKESKERALVGEVIRTVALAGQISDEYSAKRFGLDMEVEFKDDDGKPTGERLYLQLKSGDSHLKSRKRDGAEIYRIRHEDHAAYWMSQAYPVFLVIANSRGEVRWMEIRDYLKGTKDKGKQLRQIVFTGERFNVESVRRWRDQLLSQRSTHRAKRGRPTRPLHSDGRLRRPPVRG
jgi:hypothetical protein